MVIRSKRLFYSFIVFLFSVPFLLGGCWGRTFFHMPDETFSTSRKIDSLLAENARLTVKVDSLAEKSKVTQDYTRGANAQLKIDIEEIKDDINALKEMLRQGEPASRLRAMEKKTAAPDTTRSFVPSAPDTALAAPSSSVGSPNATKIGKEPSAAKNTFAAGESTAAGGNRKLSGVDTVRASAVPSPEKIYRQGYLYFNRGDYKLAIEELDNFLKAYPDDFLGEDVHFLKGESFFELGSFFDAIKEFSVILSKYPRGDKVPGALFRMALAYEKVGEKDLALEVARRLVREHPYTEEASAAKDHFKELSEN